MKSFKSLFIYVFLALIVTLPNAVFAECLFPTGEQLCAARTGGICPSTGWWCRNDDCLGKNLGSEITLVPGGVYPSLWIARTQGRIVQLGGYDCNVKPVPGVTILELPDFPNGHPGCFVGLQKDGHMYLEFFGTQPEEECVAWSECQCY